MLQTRKQICYPELPRLTLGDLFFYSALLTFGGFLLAVPLDATGQSSPPSTIPHALHYCIRLAPICSWWGREPLRLASHLCLVEGLMGFWIVCESQMKEQRHPLSWRLGPCDVGDTWYPISNTLVPRP